MDDWRYCEDCRWVKLSWTLLGRPWDEDRCRHPEAMPANLVRRKSFGISCVTMRATKCGEEGRLWERPSGPEPPSRPSGEHGQPESRDPAADS